MWREKNLHGCDEEMKEKSGELNFSLAFFFCHGSYLGSWRCFFHCFCGQVHWSWPPAHRLRSSGSSPCSAVNLFDVKTTEFITPLEVERLFTAPQNSCCKNGNTEWTTHEYTHKYTHTAGPKKPLNAPLCTSTRFAQETGKVFFSFKFMGHSGSVESFAASQQESHRVWIPFLTYLSILLCRCH